MALATFDNKIVISVLVGAASLELADFQTPLIASDSMGVGFTDTYRTYRVAGDVSDDSDLSNELEDMLLTMFSQQTRPNKILVGKLGRQANSVRLEGLAAGTAGNTITVHVLDDQVVFTSTGAENAAAIVDDLKNKLDALDLGDSSITTTDEGDTLLVVGGVVGEDLEITVEVTGTATATATTVAAAIDWSDALQALYEATSWYFLLTESGVQADILKAAAWSEISKRLYFPQSLEADILDADSTTDIAALLVALGYKQTALAYSSVTSSYKAAAWVGNRAHFNPLTRSAPWDTVPLVGELAESLTTTQASAALAKKVNLLLKYRSRGSIVVMGEGTVSSGHDIAHILSANWLEQTMSDRLAALKLARSQAGRKLELDASGQNAALAELRSVLTDAQRAGHIKSGWQVSAPDTISDADLASNTMRLSWGADPLRGAKNLVVDGYLFDGASELQL